MDMLEEILYFTYQNWLTILLFIASIPLAIFINKRFFPKKRIAYAINTSLKFAQPKVPDLEILYKGQPVSNLYNSRILLLNIGKSVIYKEDVPKGYPIKIGCINENIDILSGNITFVSRPANHLSLNKDFCLEFDYLNPNDGCIIEIMFTSSNPISNLNPITEDKFRIDGELMGIDDIEKLSAFLLKDYSTIGFFIIFSSTSIVLFPLANWITPNFWTHEKSLTLILYLYSVLFFGMFVMRYVFYNLLNRLIGMKRFSILQKFK